MLSSLTAVAETDTSMMMMTVTERLFLNTLSSATLRYFLMSMLFVEVPWKVNNCHRSLQSR